jgi:hypothetical protein
MIKDDSIEEEEVIEEMKENLKKIINDERTSLWGNSDFKEEVTSVKKLLNEYKYLEGKFPKEELAEIISNKDAAIPELLNIMKDVRDSYEKYLKDESFIYIYATYLLAQFKVEEFFEIIIDIAKLPGETLHDLFGDTITEALGRIIASVYNGDIKLIHELIENKDVDMFVRYQGIYSLVALVLQGTLEREKVVAYLKNLLTARAKEDNNLVIAGIIEGLAYLYPEEAMDEIKWAYENHLIDETIIDLNYVLEKLEMGKEACIEDNKPFKQTQLIGDINDEMGRWYGFNNKEKHNPLTVNEIKAKPKSKPKNLNKGTRIVKEHKIGRNEPCPCNSGKKYKKCCGKHA